MVHSMQQLLTEVLVKSVSFCLSHLSAKVSTRHEQATWIIPGASYILQTRKSHKTFNLEMNYWSVVDFTFTYH